MMLGRFAAAAMFMAVATSTMCAAADHRLLVLEGSWVKWGEPHWRAGAIVSYGFASAAQQSPEARNCASLTPFDDLIAKTSLPGDKVRSEAEAAFATWSNATGLSFVETKDATKADIVIGAQGNPAGRAFTNVELDARPMAEAPPAAERGFTLSVEPLSAGVQPQGLRPIHKALICFNPLAKWKIGFDGNLDVYDFRYTLTHEIGHAIGLDHPGVAGALMDFRYDEKLKGLSQGDIDAAQRLYGPHAK
jgi:Matrixin